MVGYIGNFLKVLCKYSRLQYIILFDKNPARDQHESCLSPVNSYIISWDI